MRTWSEFYWAEATGTTLWVYPPMRHGDVGTRRRGEVSPSPLSPFPCLTLSLSTSGEYVLDVTAQYWDEDGVLWMGSARGAGVVETPSSSLVAHRQRGITKFMENRPQWFFMWQIRREGLKEGGPCELHSLQPGRISC